MYFAKPKKKRRKAKAFVGLAAAAAIVYGLYLGWEWYNRDYLAPHYAEAASMAIEDARSLLAEGKVDAAREKLTSLIHPRQGNAIPVDALMLLAQVEVSQGAQEKAIEYLKTAVEKYPTSPSHAQASLAYARALEQQGDSDAAYAQYARVRDTAPPKLRAPATLAFARKAEREGARDEARTLYRDALDEAHWDSDAWREAIARLGNMNVEDLFAPGPGRDSEEYVVQAGDSLTSIGMKLNTTLGLLMRANGIEDPTKLTVGARLKYTPREFSLVIERSSCRLFLLDKAGIFKVYPVGLGMPGHETTLGSYTIGNKQKDPAWFKPGEGEIPPLDPRNELGTRWMPLVPAEEGLPQDLGIHGTIAPESIGGYTSHGCARMLKEDVEELYDIVVRATPVQIVEHYRPRED